MALTAILLSVVLVTASAAALLKLWLQDRHQFSVAQQRSLYAIMFAAFYVGMTAF